jgi:hypothetical protein
MEIENPFEEVVAPGRRLNATRISKHRGGKTKPMNPARKARNNNKLIREARARELDRQAMFGA